MDRDTLQLIVAVIRASLVTALLYFFGPSLNKYINSTSLKNKFLHRISQKDKKARELIVEYYWLVGLLVFTVNILILYLFLIYN